MLLDIMQFITEVLSYIVVEVVYFHEFEFFLLLLLLDFSLEGVKW